jgi:hypothetical protein
MPSSPSLQAWRLLIAAGQRRSIRPLFLPSSALAPKNYAASVNYLTLGRRKICEPPFRQAQRRQRGMHMRSTSIAIAIVVAIGLTWSVAAMSKLVPVDGSEMRSAAISAHPE